MKISKIIIYVLIGSVLFSPMCGCTRKKDKPTGESETESESYVQAPANTGQVVKTEEPTPQAPTPDVPAKAEKETDKNGSELLQKQVEEVRKTFLSLQEVCRANDVDGYLNFWDDETKMEIDGRDLNLDERGDNRRKSLMKKPGMLQEIANSKIESITVDTSQAEKTEILFGAEIKGTMMVVRTDGRAFLFHETDKGWKLFTIASPEYFR